MAKVFQVDSADSLLASLVSYWKMEGAGVDFYGSNHLAVAGNTSFPAGKVGNAASFDGTDDYLDGGDILDKLRTEPFSISLWVKRSSTGASMSMVTKYDDVNDLGWIFYFASDDKIRFTIGASAANQIRCVTPVNTSTAWQHVVLTYDGSSNVSGVKIYVDNVLQTLTTETNALSGTTSNAISFNIGSCNDGAFADMNGLIDEVGFWSAVLTATQVGYLYNSGNGQTMILSGWLNSPSNLVDFSASSSFVNIFAYRQLGDATRVRLSGRHILVSELSAGQGVREVKVRLVKTGTPDGNVVVGIYDKSTHALLYTSNTVIPASVIDGTVRVYNFFFDPNTVAVDADIMVTMTGNTNGDNTNHNIGVGYTTETGRLSLYDDSGGVPTVGWTYQTTNNGRFTIVVDTKPSNLPPRTLVNQAVMRSSVY